MQGVLQDHQGIYDLSLQIPATEVDLRPFLVDEIASHSQQYGVEMDRSVISELHLSRLPGQLPLQYFLAALSSINDLQVWVYQGWSHPVVYKMERQDIAHEDSKWVHLECLSIVRYNPLTENKLNSVPALLSQLDMYESQQYIEELRNWNDTLLGIGTVEAPTLAYDTEP